MRLRDFQKGNKKIRPSVRDGYKFRDTTLIPMTLLSQALYNVPTYVFPLTGIGRRDLILLQSRSSGMIFILPVIPARTDRRLSEIQVENYSFPSQDLTMCCAYQKHGFIILLYEKLSRIFLYTLLKTLKIDVRH